MCVHVHACACVHVCACHGEKSTQKLCAFTAGELHLADPLGDSTAQCLLSSCRVRSAQVPAEGHRDEVPAERWRLSPLCGTGDSVLETLSQFLRLIFPLSPGTCCFNQVFIPRNRLIRRGLLAHERACLAWPWTSASAVCTLWRTRGFTVL